MASLESPLLTLNLQILICSVSQVLGLKVGTTVGTTVGTKVILNHTDGDVNQTGCNRGEVFTAGFQQNR